MMERMNFFGAILCLFLIVGATAKAGFGQDYSKASEQKLRGDVARFTSEVKQSASSAYLARFTIAEKNTQLYFVPKKSLWTKLSEVEKVRIVTDWWRRWRTIRGADDQRNEKITDDKATTEMKDEKGAWSPMNFVKENGVWKASLE